MVFEKIKEIILDNLDEEVEITVETNLNEDLDIDSLDLFQIINDIEDEFDIKIDDTDSAKTVADIIKIVENK